MRNISFFCSGNHIYTFCMSSISWMLFLFRYAPTIIWEKRLEMFHEECLFFINYHFVSSSNHIIIVFPYHLLTIRYNNYPKMSKIQMAWWESRYLKAKSTKELHSKDGKNLLFNFNCLPWFEFSINHWLVDLCKRQPHPKLSIPSPVSKLWNSTTAKSEKHVELFNPRKHSWWFGHAFIRWNANIFAEQKSLFYRS